MPPRRFQKRRGQLKPPRRFRRFPSGWPHEAALMKPLGGSFVWLIEAAAAGSGPLRPWPRLAVAELAIRPLLCLKMLSLLDDAVSASRCCLCLTMPSLLQDAGARDSPPPAPLLGGSRQAASRRLGEGAGCRHAREGGYRPPSRACSRRGCPCGHDDGCHVRVRTVSKEEA